MSDNKQLKNPHAVADKIKQIQDETGEKMVKGEKLLNTALSTQRSYTALLAGNVVAALMTPTLNNVAIPTLSLLSVVEIKHMRSALREADVMCAARLGELKTIEEEAA